MTDGPADPLLRIFDGAEDMTRVLADLVVARLEAGIGARGHASLVASGGTTPGPLYDALSKRSLPWDKIAVTLSDERWVPPDDARSNEKLLRDRLLRADAEAARLVPLKTDDATPDEGAPAADAAIAALPRPFDLTLLGMGDDGHTASLFPGNAGLDAALDRDALALVRPVHAPGIAPVGERVTLTLRALLDSRLIVVLIRGAEKMAAYRNARAGTDPQTAPIRAILHQRMAPVQVFWSP
jgi:6-phosphogluconolactonase